MSSYSKSTTVALSLTTLTLIFCYLGTVGIGIVSARPGPNPQPQTRVTNNVDHDLGFPGQFGGGGQQIDPSQMLQAYRQTVETFLIAYAEDMAEDATKKCHAIKVPVDYEGLKTDMVTCLQSAVKKVVNKYLEIAMEFLSDSSFQQELENIQNTLKGKRPLSSAQKKFITDKILHPACETFLPLLSECNTPEYKHLATFQQCKSEVEKDAEELGSVFLHDVCRNDGAWIFDLLEADPYKCAEPIAKYTQSQDYFACRSELESMIPQQDLSKAHRIQLETKEQFCNLTTVYRGCMNNFLIDSCPENPKFGQVLLDTFKGTRDQMSAICGATGILSNLGFVMIAVMITKFMQNFFG